MDLSEIERLRRENEARLKELEEMYISKKTNSSVGGWIREKMGFKNQSFSPKNQDISAGAPREKSGKKVRIADEEAPEEGEDIEYNWKR